MQSDKSRCSQSKRVSGSAKAEAVSTLDRNLSSKEDEEEPLGILLDVFHGLFAMLTACVDESGNTDRASIFCVAGVLYDRKSIRHASRVWKQELDRAGIRYFHAVECAHFRGEFEEKPPAFRNTVHQRLIAVLNKYACGTTTVCAIPTQEFTFKSADWRGYSLYTVCAYLCMQTTIALADRLGHKQEISFFIESGHPRMGELCSLLKQQRRAGWKGVESVQFTDKSGFRPVQAADLLAYETHKRLVDMLDVPKTKSERRLRRSLKAIISGTNTRTHPIMVLSENVRERFLRSLL
jgi:hypothetical protein